MNLQLIKQNRKLIGGHCETYSQLASSVIGNRNIRDSIYRGIISGVVWQHGVPKLLLRSLIRFDPLTGLWHAAKENTATFVLKSPPSPTVWHLVACHDGNFLVCSAAFGLKAVIFPSKARLPREPFQHMELENVLKVFLEYASWK